MRAFIISEKVNGIEKQTQTLLKTLVNMLIIDSDEKQQKMQTHEQIKIFFSRVNSFVLRIFRAYWHI